MDMADGSQSTSRTAGMPRYPLPFFISFEIDPAARVRLSRGRYCEAGHDCEPGAFTVVEAGDAPERLDAWLGNDGLPVRHGPDKTPGMHAVGIQTERGEVVIR